MKEEPFYKYLSYEHAEMMENEGQIRLGTLYEYRNIEKYNLEVGDKNEGKLSRIHNITAPDTYNKLEEKHPGTQGIKWDGSGTLKIGNCIFENVENFPDSYIYCLTQEYNKNIMKEFGYDCCIEIFRPFMFFSAIYEYLHYLSDTNLEGYFANFCVYKPREEIYDNPSEIPPCLLKEPKYKHQKEFRAVYIPHDKEKPIEPLIFRHDCIPSTCRILK